jgi:hypothetical protein
MLKRPGQGGLREVLPVNASLSVQRLCRSAAWFRA